MLSISEAIDSQIEINKFLAKNGIRDLVGHYGELLVEHALGGELQGAVNKGFDLKHEDYNRVEIKTRKYELLKNGKVRKENRAVGFVGKEGRFDWLAHIVLNESFEVVNACLAKYSEVWPEIQKKTGKVGYNTSSSLPGSIDITSNIQNSQKEINNR